MHFKYGQKRNLAAVGFGAICIYLVSIFAIGAEGLKADMQTATLHSTDAPKATFLSFTPLALEHRPAVDTATAAHYLNRRPQTLRGWASAETFPDGLRPLRVHGRLAWPVDGIRRALGVA